MLLARRGNQHPLLDPVEILGEAVRVAFHRFDHVLDDRLEQGGGRADLAAGAQRSAHRFQRVQALPAPADEQRLGHGEMQKAAFIGDAAQAADEIGEHAIDAASVGMQLLMPVIRQQQLARGCGQIETRLEKIAGARVGEIEMQPQPSQAGGDRPIDRQLLDPAVGSEAKRADEPRQHLRVTEPDRRHRGRELQEQSPREKTFPNNKGPRLLHSCDSPPRRLCPLRRIGDRSTQ